MGVCASETMYVKHVDKRYIPNMLYTLDDVSFHLLKLKMTHLIL